MQRKTMRRLQPALGSVLRIGPCLALLAAGLAAAPARADDYQLIVYTPLSVNKVDGSQGCPEVAASGKRIRAGCEPDGELVFSVHVPQVKGGVMDCLVTLREAGPERESFVGIDAGNYDSDDRVRRCEENIAIRPGERYRGRQHMHVTKSGW